MTELNNALIALRIRVHARIEAIAAETPTPFVQPLPTPSSTDSPQAVPDRPSEELSVDPTPPAPSAGASRAVSLLPQPGNPASVGGPIALGSSQSGISAPPTAHPRPTEKSSSTEFDQDESPLRKGLISSFISAARRLLDGFSRFKNR